MKQYKFLLKDKYDGSISDGIVSGEDWKEAWKRLSPLLRAGHTILEIEDLDEAVEEGKGTNMSILQLVKPGEKVDADDKEIDVPPKLYKLTFLLLDGNQLSLMVSDLLLDTINEWFRDEEEEQAPTISLMVDGTTIVNLDRMFVGGMIVSELLDEYKNTLENEEGEDGASVEQEEPSNE